MSKKEKESFTCDNCGAEVEAEDTECPKCGLEFVESEDESFTCDNCGAEVAAEDTECPKCGLEFEEPEDKSFNKVDNDSRKEKIIYELDGVRGRHIDVYEDKVVITVKAGLGSFITGNATDGEKTIYYSDCIAIQFKKSNLAIGYLQFETAGAIMNNKSSNFFNENTFTWDETKLSNEKMEEVANYCKSRVNEYKSRKYNQYAFAFSPADEIAKFKKLLDEGVITKEEFEAKKKQLLDL